MKTMEAVWSHDEKMWWQHHQADTTVDSAKLHRKTATTEHMYRNLEKTMWTAAFRYN